MANTTRRGFFGALSAAAAGIVAASTAPEAPKPIAQTLTVHIDGKVIASHVRDEMNRWVRLQASAGTSLR